MGSPGAKGAQRWASSIPAHQAAPPCELMSPQTHHEPDPWKLDDSPGNRARASDSHQPCPIKRDELQNSRFIAFGCAGFFVCAREGASVSPIPKLPQQSGSAGLPINEIQLKTGRGPEHP